MPCTRLSAQCTGDRPWRYTTYIVSALIMFACGTQFAGDAMITQLSPKGGGAFTEEQGLLHVCVCMHVYVFSTIHRIDGHCRLCIWFPIDDYDTQTISNVAVCNCVCSLYNRTLVVVEFNQGKHVLCWQGVSTGNVCICGG
jgi:hypothetical protein